MSMKSKLCITVAAMGVSLFTHASEVWNMATGYGEGLFQTQNIHQFVADIEARTNNAITINVHSGASLYKAPEIFKAVRSKQVEMGELLIANLGNDDPLFKVDNIPFLATSMEDAQKLWDASRADIEAALEKKGVKLLYAVPWPPQNFYTKEKLEDINYFKGRKFRAYNATTSTMASLLGASPTTIQLPEIAQAFSTGAIDAMITSGATGVSTQSWDFVNHYTEVQAWLPKNMVFINNKLWRKLDSGTKEIILDAAKEAEERGWKLSYESNEQDKKILAENGMEVSQVDAQMQAELAKVGEEMIQEWLDSTGKVGQAILDNYRGK